MNFKLKVLFADALYDALINSRDYDEELLEIYANWFSDDEPEAETWERISYDLECKINDTVDINWIDESKWEEMEIV